MSEKNDSRLRRARQTRLKIRHVRPVRLTVHRTNGHIYAQITTSDGRSVLTSASTLDAVANTLSPVGEVICA